MTDSPALNPVLFHNGLLIDGRGGEPVPGGAVLVEAGLVRWAGPASDIPAELPYGTRRVDVRSDAILPGFIDCHVHMTAPGGAFNHAALAGMPRTLHTFLSAPRMKATLEAGVTTVRDLAGADAGHRKAVEQGLVVGPRMQVAVAMLSPTGGHGDMRTPEDENACSPMSRLADGDSECRRAVRDVLRKGADVIKIAATGGVWSPTDQPDDEGFLEDEIRVIVDIAAGHRGKKVTAHAQGKGGILNALRGGCASIEHGYEITDEAVDLMLANGAFLVPTLTTLNTDPDPSKATGVQYAKKRRWQEIGRAHLPHAIARGVRVAMGTDCGIAEHGTNLRELAYLVEYGMTPMAALKAGTSEAAELLGLSDEIGTLETGKRADLVIARGNPLQDIGSLSKPENILLVMKDGIAYKDTDALTA